MMTSQSHDGGRAPESRDLTFALLASRLSEVSEHVGRMAARLEAAEAAVERNASLLAETADLAREVSRLSAAIAGQDSAEPGRPGPVHPRRPSWAAMNHAQYADALRDLALWVTTNLLPCHLAASPALMK